MFSLALHSITERIAIQDWRKVAVILGLSALMGIMIAMGGLLASAALLGLPVGILLVSWLFRDAHAGINLSILIGFFSSGIGRYVDAPWGLLMDAFLFISWLSLLLRKPGTVPWRHLRNDVMLVALIWYGLVVLEIANPESNGLVCWFYAMRGAGFYQLLCFGLVFLLYREPKYLDRFLWLMVGYSLLGTAWGFRQMITGMDAAEMRWLYVEGHAMTHVLHGVLRVFSFYSDAGQFGSSQAMVALICGIIAVGKVKPWERWFYGIAALVTFIGFAISGTRGALAVPGAGAVVYLIMSKNFKILTIGFLMIAGVFIFLKYTFALQGVEQVRRMRTALNFEDASLQVRLKNQITFGNYLRSRPFGGGIGAAGFWGYRFNPNSLLANTATDSYYVKVWAETGIIGISLHLFMFGFILGKGAGVLWRIRNPVIHIKSLALYCGVAGILLSSYGNQVFSQMPTGILMGIAIPLIFLAPHYENLLSKQVSSRPE